MITRAENFAAQVQNHSSHSAWAAGEERWEKSKRGPLYIASPRFSDVLAEHPGHYRISSGLCSFAQYFIGSLHTFLLFCVILLMQWFFEWCEKLAIDEQCLRPEADTNEYWESQQIHFRHTMTVKKEKSFSIDDLGDAQNTFPFC